MRNFLVNNKYWLFLLAMMGCTFSMIYAGWHVPLIFFELMLFLSPNWGDMNVMTILIILFVAAQLLFIILAPEKMHRGFPANKIVLTFSIVFIALVLLGAEFWNLFDSPGEYFGRNMINVLSVVPLWLISFFYIKYIWKQEAPADRT